MSYLRYILFITIVLICGTALANSGTDLKKLIYSDISPAEKRSGLYEIGEKVNNKEADSFVILCDSLIALNDAKVVQLKEYIKLAKAYGKRKSSDKNGLVELLKSIDTGNDKEFKFYVNSVLSRCYLLLSDYSNALGCFQSNLIYYTDDKPDLKKQVQILTNIANCYRRMKMRKQALQFASKAINIAQQTKDSLNIYDANNSLAIIYMDDQNNHKADSLFNLMQGYNNKLSRLARVAFYNNHAETKVALDKINEAEGLAEKGYSIAVEERDTFWITVILVTKASIASAQKKYTNAISLCKTAYDYSKKNKSLIWQKNACACIAQNSYENKNYKDAFDYNEIAAKLKDSILSEKNKTEMTRKEFQFEYQLKVTADSVRQMEANKVKDAQIQAQESQLRQEKIVRISLFVVAILILVFSVFIFNRFKITKRQNIIIEKQKSELEIKQKEILDSIHYAKRIQNSLLPTEKYIDRNIKNKT